MSTESGHDRPAEMPAVKTTIVGGRPPGCGSSIGPIPRGIEILIKKAAVDPEFRTVLLEQRSAAARELELTLEPAEAAMLDSVPAAQLEAIIAGTKVPEETRRMLLGKVTIAALVALGVVAGWGECERYVLKNTTLGVEADRPPGSGIAPHASPPQLEGPSSAPSKPQAPVAPTHPVSRGHRPDRPASQPED